VKEARAIAWLALAPAIAALGSLALPYLHV
jgi:hypothetical protein